MLTTLIPPAARPVTVAQVKQHLRIDHDTEDGYLESQINIAVSCTEMRLSRLMIERTMRQTVPPECVSTQVPLLAAPARQIAEVRLLLADGQSQIAEPSGYHLHRSEDAAFLKFTDPVVLNQAVQGVEIDYLAGMAASPVELPDSLIRAILILVAHFYEFRGATRTDVPQAELPSGYAVLVDPWRRLRV